MNLFAVPVSNVKFWYDRFIRLDDLERLNGCNRCRKSNRCGSQVFEYLT